MASRCIPVLFLFSFIVVAVAKPPKRCNILQCPAYKLIEEGKDFEIRSYNPSIWVSTAPIKGNSFAIASATGHSHLFSYVNGANERKIKLEMTAPAVTTVAKGDEGGSSEFAALFYVPKEYQSDPPKAEGLEVKKVDATYVAVRQFGGYAIDGIVDKEEKALRASLNGTKWDDAIKKNKRPQDYDVAQYNAPVEILADRLNEIWIPFTWTEV